MVFLGVAAVALTGTLTPAQALGGYADHRLARPLRVLDFARRSSRPDSGRRIALVFIRAIGHRSIGLAYALVGTDTLLASLVPSNGARAGGVVFPDREESCRGVRLDARADAAPTRRVPHGHRVPVRRHRLRDVPHRAGVERAHREVREGRRGVDLTYGRWFVGGLVPGLLSLILAPLLLYRLFPPDVRRTPGAAKFAADELVRLGRM